MSDQFSWESSAELDPEDEAAIDAYLAVGRALDELPYTSDFESMLQRLGKDRTDAAKHELWKRLLYLRKRGMLPRISRQRLPDQNAA